MKKRPKEPELKLPDFPATAQQGSPELSMDDYYKAVMMLLRALPRASDSQRGYAEPFVIRDEGEPRTPDRKS